MGRCFTVHCTRRMRRFAGLSTLALLVLCASCGKQAHRADYRPTTTIKELMAEIVDPTADTIWDAFSIKITAQGTEEKAPRTAEEWLALRRSAVQLVEASNLLQIPGRRVAQPGQPNAVGLELQPDEIERLISREWETWIARTHGLHAAARLTLDAIDAKDTGRILEMGGRLDAACDRCHQTFLFPRRVPPRNE